MNIFLSEISNTLILDQVILWTDFVLGSAISVALEKLNSNLEENWVKSTVPSLISWLIVLKNQFEKKNQFLL